MKESYFYLFTGEHTDYNMGLVFPMALPLVTVVLGARSEDPGSDKCRLYSSSQVGAGGSGDDGLISLSSGQRGDICPERC